MIGYAKGNTPPPPPPPPPAGQTQEENASCSETPTVTNCKYQHCVDFRKLLCQMHEECLSCDLRYLPQRCGSKALLSLVPCTA